MYNRRYLFNIGIGMYEIAKKENKVFAVAIIDIDKFKNINDTYGHDTGDIAIQEVAKILDKSITKDGLISRMGGEEFCLILNNRTKKEIEILLDTIRKDFEGNSIQTHKCTIQYTVSIGCAFDFKNSLDEMIQDADQGLYEAKENGRNQVRYR